MNLLPAWRLTFRIAVAVTFTGAATLAVSAQQQQQPADDKPQPAAAADPNPTLDQMLDLTPTPAPGSETSGSGSDAGKTPDEKLPGGLPGEASGGAELDPETERRLSADQMQDELTQAVSMMGDVSQRLARDQDAGLETLRIQQSIIDKLDQVISQMDQQQQSSSSSSSSSSGESSGDPTGGSTGAPGAPGSPAPGSPDSTGEKDKAAAQAGKAHGDKDADHAPDGEVQPGVEGGSLEELRHEWGNLPPRLRDELNEGVSEQFSPVYRRQTEEYYRRLAEVQLNEEE